MESVTRNRLDRLQFTLWVRFFHGLCVCGMLRAPSWPLMYYGILEFSLLLWRILSELGVSYIIELITCEFLAMILLLVLKCVLCEMFESAH